MMNSVFIGTLTFLIVAPAISICDEDLSEVTSSSEHEKEANSIDELATHHPNNVPGLNDPWSFYRQIRAPSGFFGVRGKKFYEYDNAEESDDEAFNYQPKRAPSQAFFGMRGKKFYDDKRAPSGFYGMRGKKFYEDDESNDNDLQAELYRELLLERMKIANLLSDYELDTDYHKVAEKRRPSGFIGSRGKKSVNNEDYYDFEKRAPMGFQGVRGKKDEYSNFIGSDEKRAPLAGFFGTRGKKEPFGYQSQSSYFGVRKKPYFGKFVGVRGKKSDDGQMRSLRLDTNNLNEGLQTAQRVQSDAAQDKRIGFVGMRG